MDEAKQKRTLAKRKFTRKANLLWKRVRTDDPPQVLQGLFEEVCSVYREVEELHELYVLLLTSEDKDNESVLEEADMYIDELEQVKHDLNAAIVKLTEKNNNDSASVSVKVKSLEPPKFSGNIRDYGTFKRDYERLMSKVYGKDPYALKMCLVGEALETVRGVEDDYCQMIERLDNKFGNVCKLTEAVVKEIKSLKPVPEGDPRKFIFMVTTLERCWLDLNKVGLEAEMNSTTMVSQIERLLPTTLKREWVLIAQAIEDSNALFRELLKFLLREKGVFEYMESDLRAPTSSRAASNFAVYTEEAKESESGIINLVRKMQETQDLHQKQILEMSQRMSGLAVKAFVKYDH